MQKTIIVLGFSVTAVGTLKCLRNLKKQGYQIILAGPKDHHAVALKSNIPHQIIIFEAPSLIEGLVSIKTNFEQKPILLFTQDNHLMEVAAERKRLIPYYRFLLPESELINTLTKKALFTEFALTNKLTIPTTIFVENEESLIKASEQFQFPLIIKPYLMHAIQVNNQSELEEVAHSLSEDNYSSCIVQQYIEGADDQLYFCFLLFDKKGQLVSTMLAQKLRQWPISYGTTSLAKTVSNEPLMREVEVFANSTPMTGFCSIEYKYDQATDRYYIMEPTVGRFNQQVALTVACGINIPERLVQIMDDIDFDTNKVQKDNIYWIYESNDLFSYVNSKPRKYPYFTILLKKHIKALFDYRDSGPVLKEMSMLAQKKLKKIFRR